MRCLERNKVNLWYALYDATTLIAGTAGEYAVTYKPAVKIAANVSPATGRASVEMFGNDVTYDKVIVVDNPACPIDENTVLYIDTAPTSGHYDYIVKRVARSLNSVSYAISKVDVS